MRTAHITKHYATFSELSEKDQAKVIEKNYDINVDFSWWELEYECLQSLASEAGISLELRDFDLERGAYVAIHNIKTDITKLLELGEAMRSNCHSFYAEVIAPFLASFTAKEKRYLKSLHNRDCLTSLTGKRDSSGYGYSRHCAEVEFFGNASTGNISRVEELVNKLEESWQQLTIDLEGFFLQSLRLQYEFLTSEEAIKETLENNGIEFEVNADGELV